METARESPDSETKETSEGLNFQVAGLTRTPAASWRPAVRLVITTPTCTPAAVRVTKKVPTLDLEPSPNLKCYRGLTTV